MSFPETRWSMLALATAHGDAHAQKALNDLCQRYWVPVFTVLCSRGYSGDNAREKTQAFFVHLLEKSTWHRADQTRGRFRTFLLTVLWRFLRDEHRRESTEKRGGHLEACVLDDVASELVSEENPLSETLDREWALTTLENALASVRSDVVAARGEAVWAVLRDFLPGSRSVPDLAVAAAKMGVSEGGVRTEVHRLRARCREAVRRELMNTVSSPEDLDEEIAYLGRTLRLAAAAVAAP